MKQHATKTDRLVTALYKRPMTEKAITSRLGIPNPRASIWYARKIGFDIETIETGIVTKYAIR